MANDFAFIYVYEFFMLKLPAFLFPAETVWLLCLPHIPCFSGHLLYFHILQSTRDQGQDF